jgi:hypothetical protein
VVIALTPELFGRGGPDLLAWVFLLPRKIITSKTPRTFAQDPCPFVFGHDEPEFLAWTFLLADEKTSKPLRTFANLTGQSDVQISGIQP